MAGYFDLVRLLAQAAHEHPDDTWAVRIKQLMPDLARHYSPPCPGAFNEMPVCDELHAHGLVCGRPEAICMQCGKTNADHR